MDPAQDAGPGPVAPHDDEVLELALRVLDLARDGETATLAAYVDAGVPANLTDAEVVRVLLEAGADPGAGSPDARETAAAFGTGHLLG